MVHVEGGIGAVLVELGCWNRLMGQDVGVACLGYCGRGSMKSKI